MHSVVQHGRRAGASRGRSASPLDMKGNCVMLSSNDVQRIRTNLQHDDEDGRLRREEAAERERLRMLSKNRVSTWSNTIEGHRLKKLEAHKERAEADEREKLRLDAEEAAIQAEQRRQAIERANQLQYYESARIRVFHSALLTSSVLKERDAQVDSKGTRDELYKKRDAELFQSELQELERMAENDRAKTVQKRKANYATAAFQKEQAERREAERKLAAQKELEFGRQVLADVDAYKQEERSKAEARQVAAKAGYKACMEAVEAQHRHQEMVRQQELEEEEQMRRYVDVKQRMIEEKTKKEARRVAAMRKIRNDIGKKNAQEIDNSIKEEDDRVEAYILAAEKKRDAAAKAKEERRLGTLAAIRSHREGEVKASEERAKNMKLMDQALLEQRVRDNEEFLRKQKEDRDDRRRRGKELEKLYSEQIEKRKAKDKMEHDEELAYEHANRQKLVEEEEKFRTYASKLIDEYERADYNTKPMRKVLNKGGDFPCEPKTSKRSMGNTADRLGLQWE